MYIASGEKLNRAVRMILFTCKKHVIIVWYHRDYLYCTYGLAEGLELFVGIGLTVGLREGKFVGLNVLHKYNECWNGMELLGEKVSFIASSATHVSIQHRDYIIIVWYAYRKKHLRTKAW